MLRHQLRMIFRNFLRFRGTFLINWFGLSTGMACTMLIYLWVVDELSVDKFHVNDARLFQVFENRIRSGGIWTSHTTSGPMADAMAADLPEVEASISTTWSQTHTFTVGETNLKVDGIFAGPQFFTMFSYDLISGNPANVIKDKLSITVSDVLAKKLFNTTDVVGKTIEYDHRLQLMISGVFKKMPLNASDQFDFAGSWEMLLDGGDGIKSWGNTGPRTFVLLKPGVDVNAFNKKIANYIKEKTRFEITHRTPFLVRYSDEYLHESYIDGKESGGKITYVKLFSVIAVVILLIACINFMNLSTAKASTRMKEVGIKKAIGARRSTLVAQYLGESLLMSFLSFLLAVLIVDLFLPQFNIMTGKALSLAGRPELIVTAIIVTVLTGLLAGSYPALYLSGFRPSAVLKGKHSLSFGEVWARKGLVVFQFTLSITFIAAVVVIYNQLKFVQTANLGYANDHLIIIPQEGRINGKGTETFIDEIKRMPGVLSASSIGHNLQGHNSGTSGVVWEGKDTHDRSEFENIAVNYGMTETLGLTVIEGRAFRREFPADTASILFNEAGIRYMGLKNPVGTTIRLWGSPMKIIGVVKDFNFQSMHVTIKPAFIRLAANDTWLVMARLAAGKEKESIASIEEFYKSYNPGFIFGYSFLDEQFGKLYASEQRVSLLAGYFAGLAILISSLGLLGLAAFTAERRLKEIGIRKVLGSSTMGIVYLLTSEFTRIVAIAIVIALPLSYIMLRAWLTSFAYRIPLSWTYFAGAGMAALAIAWITVSAQAYAASGVEPAKCLRNE